MSRKTLMNASKVLLFFYLCCLYYLTIGIRSITPVEERTLALTLFTSYKVAWYQWNLYAFAAIIGNILLFFPLGFLFPVVQSKYKTVWNTLLLGCTTSVIIEVIQYFSYRGVADIDDVFGNTLGALCGFCIWKLLCEHHPVKRKLLTAMPLILLVVSIASGYCIYVVKDFGNLSQQYVQHTNMENISLETAVAFDSTTGLASTYKNLPWDEDTVNAFVADFADAQNLTVDENSLRVSDSGSYFYKLEDGNVWLTISAKDGTYSVQYIGNSQTSTASITHTEAEVREYLEEQGVALPVDATMSTDGDYYYFAVPFVSVTDTHSEGGVITCSLNEAGELISINCSVKEVVLYQSVAIRSEQEAFALIQTGEFTLWSETTAMNIQQVELTYLIDSKEILQPWYRFTYQDDTETLQSVLVPAIIY